MTDTSEDSTMNRQCEKSIPTALDRETNILDMDDAGNQPVVETSHEAANIKTVRDSKEPDNDARKKRKRRERNDCRRMQQGIVRDTCNDQKKKSRCDDGNLCHEQKDERNKKMMIKDVNSKRKILLVTGIVDTKAHLCMQLLFETNFLLKVIMEEWIMSVNQGVNGGFP
jgi:hypothetical protein